MCSSDTTSRRHADALIDAQVGQFIRPDASAGLRDARIRPRREPQTHLNRHVMNVNRYGSTHQTSHPLALMQPPRGMAAAPARPAPRIHAPDEMLRAPVGSAPDSFPHGKTYHRAPKVGGGVEPLERVAGKAVPSYRLDGSGERVRDTKDAKGNPVRDTWNADGRHTRDSVDVNGAPIHETWDADGKHTRDSVDANGERVRESWDADGEHIRERSNGSGKHVRDKWDSNGNHIRDTWDANGNHIRDVWDANGKHKRIAWHEKPDNIPPLMDAEGLTPEPAGHDGRPMPPPVTGGAPASSPLPGNGDGGSEPSAPVGGGDAGQPAEPIGGGGQPSAPIGGGSQPSTPIGNSGAQPSAPIGNGGAQLSAPTGDAGAQPSAPIGDADGQPSTPIGDSGGHPSVPTGGDSGDIQAPDNNSGHTDYDQPAPGSAQTPTLIGFTPAQGGIVNRAYQHVKRMVDSALGKLESGHPDSTFARWFGSPTQRNVQKVEQVFTRMQHAMSHDRFTFVLGAAHDNSELAHVQSSSPHQINLKPHFFDHAFGANTPEATIAHELSHFPYIGNTKDHLYGPAAVAGLAARNSDIATDNAENYGMFIRAQATA
jgi:hypothetical protein